MRLLSIFIAVLIGTGCAGAAIAQSHIHDGAVAIVNERPLSARILGGGDAEPGEYPSMVALVRSGFVPLDQRLFCGGTVVAERWILTAAHCVHDPFNQPLQPAFIRVVAGINDLALEVPEREHRIAQIIIHPDYDGSLPLPPNDIALLELEIEVAAPISTLFTGDTNDYADTLGYIAGWGAIEYSDPNNPVYPTALQDAVVPLISNELCNAPQSYDGLIVDSHVCAGYVDGQIDACAGDSGGPLYIHKNGVQVQAGITSFGSGCGLPLFYGIYTNVSHFIPWLDQYIDVPFQSPELVLLRARQENPLLAGAGSNDDGGLFSGAPGLPSLFMLLLAICQRSFVARRNAVTAS